MALYIGGALSVIGSEVARINLGTFLMPFRDLALAYAYVSAEARTHWEGVLISLVGPRA